MILGNVLEFLEWHNKIKNKLPELCVFGGSYGTNATHLESICAQIL